ncbi:MAG: hypothetical protein KAJ15_12940 [Spirochaetes bacterium]|nr:hypothetical protein [Spirochaetota bacterium]
MKDVKHLSRIQAVLPFYIILILAAIQEPALKSEFTCNIGCHISKQFDIYVFGKRDSLTSFMGNRDLLIVISHNIILLDF